ncbi:MAG: glycosyltransferase family 2 protein [Verrucomicrobiota bacterium]|nr:glycosyltransferase family 2 protein [Verrucomicrobiota bacterium]
MRFLLLLIVWVSGFADHFVSFVIPCYNCEEWVEDTIESIYEQNLEDSFEIICTDDASTDDTYNLLCALSLIHPEVKVFRHTANLGISAARNTSVRMSQGDLIFCLDPGNVLEAESMEDLIEWLDISQSDVACFSQARYFLDDLEEIGRAVYQTADEQYRLQDVLQTVDSPLFSGNYLYTRESFNRAGGYPTQYGVLDSFAFGFEQIAHGCKLTYLPETFYWHRVDSDRYVFHEPLKSQVSGPFFQFLLDHRDLLRKRSIRWLEKEIKRVHKGKSFHDFTWAILNYKLMAK